MNMTIIVVDGLTNGLSLSIISSLGHWLYPFVMSGALNKSIEPSDFRLVLNTHLQPIITIQRGLDQVPCSMFHQGYELG